MKYSTILNNELLPAFGCTEPIALALTAAKAREELGKQPDSLIVLASGNIIKNTKSVIIPGTKNLYGIEIASILGAIAGDADKNLEVLSDLDKKSILEAQRLKEEGFCKVHLVPGVPDLYIEIIANSGDESASVTVAENHTNVIKKTKNGEMIFEKELNIDHDDEYDFSFKKIYEYAQTCDISEVQETLDRQIEYNHAIAKEGMLNDYGSKIGKLSLEEDAGEENILSAYAAAGSDARMAGSEMPVVINSGSGNQGITVSVPIILHAEKIGASKEELYRALIFANLIGIYIKKGIGVLSAYCGVVSAAAASVAGIAFLNKEPIKIIADTLQNALATSSGIICDGASGSCAMKIKTSVDNALFSYKQAKSGNSFKEGDGIVKESVDQTIQTIGHIAKYGMKTTDEVIMNEMIGNRDYINKIVDDHSENK